MLPLSLVPGFRVERVQREGSSGLRITARSRRDAARCPECRHPSTAVHGYYRRHPADLPLLGRHVRLELRVRRYVCTMTSCRRRTFAEPLPQLVPPRAQRTHRLVKAQSRIGIAAGGAAGARLARHLGLGTNAATLLRLVRRTPLPARSAPTVVGVDDWAIKKRKSYGTIIVDLEQHQSVDLLPDRTAGTLAAFPGTKSQVSRWLRPCRTQPARNTPRCWRHAAVPRDAAAKAPALCGRGSSREVEQRQHAVDVERWRFEAGRFRPIADIAPAIFRLFAAQCQGGRRSRAINAVDDSSLGLTLQPS